MCIRDSNKYDASGNLLAEIPAPLGPSDVILNDNNELFVSYLNRDEIWKFDNDGGNSQIFAEVDSAAEMAFSDNGNLFVVQLTLGQVTVLSANGSDLGVFPPGALEGANGLAFDPFGNLYVGDNSLDNIRKFSPAGEDLGVFSAGIGVPVGITIVAKSSGCTSPIGDVNSDGNVDLLDVTPFVNLLIASEFLCEADINVDGNIDLLDVTPFVELLMQ